ncbi:MAG: hypothetical protein AAGC60_30625 [Acidobacteriota bacterium]
MPLTTLDPRRSFLTTTPPVALETSVSTPGARHAWALLKPVDEAYLRRAGVRLDLEALRRIASSYDPALEAAAIKVDHVHAGPAQGWVRRMWLDEQGVVWIEPEDLDAALAEGIRARRYRYLSAEIDLQHPETGGPYLTGVAVLGASKPAIKGLPSIQLADRRAVRRLVDVTPTTEMPMVSETQPPNTSAQAPPVKATPSAPPAPPPAPPPPDPPTIDLEALGALRRENELLREHLEASRRERIRAAVDARLGALGRRITPSMRREGLAEALVELEIAAESDAPALIELSGQEPDGVTRTVERTAVEAIFRALEALPTLAGLSAGELALEDGPEGRTEEAPSAALSDEERQILAAHGIDEARYAEITRAHGLR